MTLCVPQVDDIDKISLLLEHHAPVDHAPFEHHGVEGSKIEEGVGAPPGRQPTVRLTVRPGSRLTSLTSFTRLLRSGLRLLQNLRRMGLLQDHTWCTPTPCTLH